MPRSIDSSAELSLQGSLFGAPEPTVHAAKNKVSTGDLLALNAGDDNLRNKDLSDADLSDDALTRPRRRREADGVEADCVDETNGNSTTDEPAWAHHSQLQPEQLTPVLRHYVELKMAHPERVLLYRLGATFLNASLKTRSPCRGSWSSPSRGKMLAKQSGACRWRAFPITPPSATAVT